jgi:hypothetical protein
MRCTTSLTGFSHYRQMYYWLGHNYRIYMHNSATTIYLSKCPSLIAERPMPIPPHVTAIRPSQQNTPQLHKTAPPGGEAYFPDDDDWWSSIRILRQALRRGFSIDFRYFDDTMISFSVNDDFNRLSDILSDDFDFRLNICFKIYFDSRARE